METRDTKFPKQIKFIVGNEACERFSFYGIKGILMGYMTTRLFMGNDEAVAIMHLFVAINYFMPLLGGWISDRFWGRYHTILWVSLLYCVGHAILAMSDVSADVETRKWVMMSGLMCIAFGSGGIKPCVSAFMGDQFKPEQGFLLKKAYAAFYWSINFGSCFAFLVIPWMQENHGWSWAFVVPGITMSLATTIFWLGRRNYVNVAPSGKKEKGTGVFSVWWHCLRNRKKGQDFWNPAIGRFTDDQVDGSRSVIRILKIFALIPPFWALFEQTASSWLMQGKQMATITLDVGFDQWTIGAAQLQSANPIFVMILIPFITMVVYPRVAWLNSPLRRMSAGMVFAAVAFGLVAWIQYSLTGGSSMSLAWQIWPYLALTIGEILLSTTGLEFAFTQAPAKMKSMITSFWNLTIAIGNIMVSVITTVFQVEGEGHSVTTGRFLSYAVMMLAVAFIFMWVCSRYMKEKKGS